MVKQPEKKLPDPIDAYVGGRLRARRSGLRISQTKLGDAIDVSFQQIQKYENGTNRICASKLYKLSRQLNVDVSFFFQDIPEEVYEESQQSSNGFSESLAEPYDADPFSSRTSLALLHDFESIPDEELKHKMSQFIRALADSFKGTFRTDEEL